MGVVSLPLPLRFLTSLSILNRVHVPFLSVPGCRLCRVVVSRMLLSFPASDPSDLLESSHDVSPYILHSLKNLFMLFSNSLQWHYFCRWCCSFHEWNPLHLMMYTSGTLVYSLKCSSNFSMSNAMSSKSNSNVYFGVSVSVHLATVYADLKCASLEESFQFGCIYQYVHGVVRVL